MPGNKKGFTLMELVIVVAILGIVFIGIIKVFDFALKTWWHGSAGNIIQTDSSQASNMLMQDIKNCMGASFASPVYDPNFENFTSTSQPYGWSAFTAEETRETSTSTVHSGRYSLKKTGAAAYVSVSLTIENPGYYILTGWVYPKTGNGRIETTGSFATALSSTSQTSSKRWEKLRAEGTSSGNTTQIQLSCPVAGECYFDDLAIYLGTTTLSAAGNVAFTTFVTEAGTGNWRRYRYRFTGATGYLYREQETAFGSGTWIDVGYNPAASNVKSVLFTHEIDSNGEDAIRLIMRMEKDIAAFSSNREYMIDTMIKPGL